MANAFMRPLLATEHGAFDSGAEAPDAGLRVVSPHGGAALVRAWIGGTAKKVIGLARCPAPVHVNSPHPEAPTP